jgi:hypothetical protein
VGFSCVQVVARWVGGRPGAVAVAGGLAMLTAGCQVPGLSSAAPTSTVPSPGSTWSVYTPGKPQPARTPLLAAASGVHVALPTPALALKLPTAAPAAASRTLTPSQLADLCYGRPREGKIDTLAVAPDAGSATVTWPNAGNSAVVTYRVAAVSQNMSAGSQAAPTWVNVPPATGCAPVTMTFPGLRRGGRYVFWLDAVTKNGASGTSETTIAESVGVQIP